MSITYAGSPMADEQARRVTKKARLLALLEAAGPDGATNGQCNAITYRYTGRIQELRDEGYAIDSIDEGGGRWRFVLRSATPTPGPRPKQARVPRLRPFGPDADRIVAEAARILRARRAALAAVPPPPSLF